MWPAFGYIGCSVSVVDEGTVVGKDRAGMDVTVSTGNPVVNGPRMWCTQADLQKLRDASSPTPPNTQPSCANGGESKPEDAR